MAGKTIPVLFITANVGSIFEDPSVMLKIWTDEFLNTVARLNPKFVAIHCQEVGGKNYERSMKYVEDFVRLIISSEELRLFNKVRIFLDEDFSSAENFTALGNFYFIHETVSEALIWDFASMVFVPATGKEVHSGNIESVTTKEKAKFPQDFFPECKWSRKGFLRTRWSLHGTVFDLVNIHLFHDASNFLAMDSFPSVYCKNRRRTLEHTLERFHNDCYGTAPFFVFGDFNFRTDTQGVVARLSQGLNQVRVQSSKTDQTKMQFQDEDSQVVLSVGKKEFSHSQHQNIFTGEEGSWLRDFDRELESFSENLFEFPITFAPSYPFEEDENGAKNYMRTRCPAWCDRVVLANTAMSLVNNLSDPCCVEYGVIGPNTCMGDHKPVYLKLELLVNTGIVRCCLVNRTAVLGTSFCLNGLSRLPVLDTLSLPRVASYVHEPYTPESMDTPSPIPSPTPGNMCELHKSFNDSVTARLRQQTANIQGEQGSIPHTRREADWTHTQSSEPSDEPLLNDKYLEDNANIRLQHLDYSDETYDMNTLQTFEGLITKPLFESPKVLVTQATQFNTGNLNVEGCFTKSVATDGCNKPLLDKADEQQTGATEKVEVSFSVVLSGSAEIEVQKIAEAKVIQNLNNRVSSQETLSNSVKDITAGEDKRLPRTFVKCLQSQSAVEVLDNFDAMIRNDSDLFLPIPPIIGMRTKRCFSDASWLQQNAINKPLNRVRLISSSKSLTRLRSHHSSSDEDWFEEVQETESLISKDKVNAPTGDFNQNDINASSPGVSCPLLGNSSIEELYRETRAPENIVRVTDRTQGPPSAMDVIPDVCALLHPPETLSPKPDSEVVRLLKKQSTSSDEMSFQLVAREGGDTSPASHIEIFQKQSEALINESHSSAPDGQLKPVEEELVENDTRCFKCCVIL